MHSGRSVVPGAMLLLGLSACAAEGELEPGDPWADSVASFAPAANASFGHEGLPEIVLGPPGGFYDVASLGCGGSIVLGFDEPVVDREGPDLIVFENPFEADFPEPGVVAVSEDGETFVEFDCDPVALVGCAGVTPTLAGPDSGLSASDPEVSGGDLFDLADLGLEEINFVRITDVSAEYWALEGIDYCDAMGSGGFDLDAVARVE